MFRESMNFIKSLIVRLMIDLHGLYGYSPAWYKMVGGRQVDLSIVLQLRLLDEF